jgi:hypothetical protein
MKEEGTDGKTAQHHAGDQPLAKDQQDLVHGLARSLG